MSAELTEANRAVERAYGLPFRDVLDEWSASAPGNTCGARITINRRPVLCTRPAGVCVYVHAAVGVSPTGGGIRLLAMWAEPTK